MNPYTLAEEREEKRRKEAYAKHPCKRCSYATWQGEHKVSCLFAKCVKDDPLLSGIYKRNITPVVE